MIREAIEMAIQKKLLWLLIIAGVILTAVIVMWFLNAAEFADSGSPFELPTELAFEAESTAEAFSEEDEPELHKGERIDEDILKEINERLEAYQSKKKN